MLISVLVVKDCIMRWHCDETTHPETILEKS